MRRFALLSLVLSAGALPLAAQFEGTVVMKMDANGKAETMTWYVRHDQLAMSMPMSQADPHATGEFRMVIDQAHHTSTMLVPMTPEMAKGMGAMAGNAAAPLSAQQSIAGSATWHMTMPTPQANAAATMLGPSMAMTMTASTDGRQIAIQVALDSAQPMMAGMHLVTVMTVGNDTVHVGIMLPPAMAGAAGGSPGFRMDVPMSGLAALTPMLGAMADSTVNKTIDSISAKVAQLQYHALGTTSVVAGLTCENWDIVDGGADTTRTCVIPMPPGLAELQAGLMATVGAQKLLSRIPGLATVTAHAYGGRKMLPIETTASSTGMHMVLTNVSATPPDSSVFTLPADLRPMPIPGGGGGGGGGGGR